MFQLLQNLRDGRTVLEEVPAPGPVPGSLLIQSSSSLVSAGTERMLVNFGKAGWLGKIRQQPEKVRAVLGKVRAEGPVATWNAVRSKLDQSIPLGYCQAGLVIDAGGVAWARAGQRVVSNGPHAEVVSISQGMCAEIPDGVDDEAAIFTPLASVALQGINLLELKTGDKVIVMGLGLIGQLAVRILHAMGCEVLGFDPSEQRCRLAAQSGAQFAPDGSDPVSAALSWTSGLGVRGVLITASTSSNELVSQAARSCGLRGKVVLIGVVGLQLNRADFYSREVMFQVSCSYGARDSRSPHSAQKNFRQVLGWMAEGRLTVADLVTHRSPFVEAPAAYGALGDPRALGIVLQYGDPAAAPAPLARTIELRATAPTSIAVIGAGNFAVRTLLPAIATQHPPVAVAVIASERGLSASYAARKFMAARATTDTAIVLSEPNVSTVFVATRHNSHAVQAKAALAAGKHVWVEKPLALSLDDVESIGAAARLGNKTLMVGFNRRFAPMALRVKRRLSTRSGPVRIEIQVNAGRLDRDHWTLDPRVGGGRIVGEGCHFIDLMRFLTGAPIASARCIRRDQDGQDGGCFELLFEGGSRGVLDYRTDLPPHVPKEKISVYGDGIEVVIHNWSRVTASGLAGAAESGGWWREPRKGHREAIHAFLNSVQTGGSPPIPLAEILEVSRWAIQLQTLNTGQTSADLRPDN
jgi:predicted dehydrogenase/threonine dehydrogenase-like Zn-dependent dehydrogenase